LTEKCSGGSGGRKITSRYAWEQALMNINPDRARVDPVIVRNVPYYKAQLQVQAEVDQLQPPPRPANWVVSRPVPVVFVSVKYVSLLCLWM